MKTARKIKRRSDCAVSFGLDIFGDKWTLLILRDILFYHQTRFSEFAAQEHIATNILADRLNTLEATGIIEKRRDEKFKNQFVYSVTKKGEGLLPLLIEMVLWGVQYDPKTPATKNFIRRTKADKKALISDMVKSFANNSFRELGRGK